MTSNTLIFHIDIFAGKLQNSTGLETDYRTGCLCKVWQDLNETCECDNDKYAYGEEEWIFF
jgi:hypothetical protein